MERKLVAILACRNGGTRLYAKPLQNLDEKKKISILQFLITNLKKRTVIDDIGLAISNDKENLIYKKIAIKNKIHFVFGDDTDVLSRLIKCAKKIKATDILRITSESPFPFLLNLPNIWKKHKKNNYDASFLDNIVDGCGFEIIKLKALENSHKFGKKIHRSEFCTLYIRENFSKFKINKIYSKKKFFRKDLRLTVDNPEDLIVCRSVYKKFKDQSLDLNKTIPFLDKQPHLKKLTKKFCKTGYKIMYL